MRKKDNIFLSILYRLGQIILHLFIIIMKGLEFFLKAISTYLLNDKNYRK